MTLTIENGIDLSLLKKFLENIKGVIAVSFERERVRDLQETSAEQQEWLNKMTSLSASVSPELLNMDDERTRYIMSK